MNKLNAKELDLLQRIGEKEELQPLFFRKAKGLKWFTPLYERGFFKPENNPKPEAADEEGFFTIPFWPAIDYLVRSASEIPSGDSEGYAKKILQILIDCTKYAEKNNFGNYRTWWQFSEILALLPYREISIEDLEVIDYWLDDKFDRCLVAPVVGEKLLPKLLKIGDSHSLNLSKKIIEILFKIQFKNDSENKDEFFLRVDHHWIDKIIKKTAFLAGEKLGLEVISIFHSNLKTVLEETNKDTWSSIWQPAIEDHEQNRLRDKAENSLIQAFRDSLHGYIKANPNEAAGFVREMLVSDFQTIKRIAIHAVSEKLSFFTDCIDLVLAEDFFYSNYRHEMWHFLNKNYSQFSESQKAKVLDLLNGITRQDDKGEIHQGATAYTKSTWFSAIKDHGEEEKKLYEKFSKIAGTEPDHPDFSSYISTGWVSKKSPKNLDELKALSLNQLVKELKNFEEPEGFDKPCLEGLLEVFNQLIKEKPLAFYLNLNYFSNLDFSCLHQIIEAYKELWSDRVKLPWEEIWDKLLEFCSNIVSQKRFNELKSSNQQKQVWTDYHRLISSISQLIEAGAKSDNAFNENRVKIAEEILFNLLRHKVGSEFEENSDAVFVAINSARGHCLQALINLSLCACRIADQHNDKDHSMAWQKFQHFYDAELKILDPEKVEFEFATLVAMYLPNFLYMSKKWTLGNLEKIFNQNNYLRWLCAMQGYAYVGTAYQEIYQFLKTHGDYIKALDDPNIKDRVREKVIQDITLAYLKDLESFDDRKSLIKLLVTRKNQDEKSHLIWFLCTLDKNKPQKEKNKIFELWQNIQQELDFSEKKDRITASNLCGFARFIGKFDNESLELLLEIASYSDEAHNAYELLENISVISDAQPFEAHKVWMKMLEGSMADYPEEAIKKLFSNLLNEGPEGFRKAKEVESEYLKKGNERPSIWLREIKRE
ncbi:MAG: hypothetical protein ACQETH_14790 [Candidatus Rifleibacteriota bacterium]